MPPALLAASAEPDPLRPALPETTSRPSSRLAGSEKRPFAQRFALAILLIGAAALIGYVLSRPTSDSRDPDVLTRSVEAVDQLQAMLDTEDPLDAQQLIRAEFGWRVGVPVFEALALRSVAVAPVAPAVEVPVFLYGTDEQEVAVFIYSYALLDQVPDRLRLTPSDYDDLVGTDPVVRRADGQDLLLWRDRDDIYVAVTDVAPSSLAEGLTMAR